jgi:hypothetical protein
MRPRAWRTTRVEAILKLRPKRKELRMETRTACPSIDAIIKDPVNHYRAPRDVVADTRLTRGEKRRVLESWALDAQLIAVADEENMGGSQRPELREVKLALLELERNG